MGKWMQSITARVLGIGLLALLMLIPLTQVQGLVAERAALRDEAATKIAQGWGGRQVLGGLVLAVPTRRTEIREGKAAVVRDSEQIVLADSMQTRASLDVTKRSYGMYEVPVYVADTHVTARFLLADLKRAEQGSDAEWSGAKAELRLLLADPQGLRDVSNLRINGVPQRFGSSSERIGGLATVSVPLDLAQYDASVDVELDLKLAGTESFQVLPLARQSRLDVQAPWADPSFSGALLPAERKVDAKGFTATWRMLDLNRSYGQNWDAENQAINAMLAPSAFGVDLYQPANVYQQNERAGKYGLLFIVLTFVAFFMFDVLKRMRVHPVQYLLIGAALATFYVVLLALSEQIGFGYAYLVASAAVVGIVAGYASAVLGAWRAGLLLGGVLALVYAILYGLIGAEQYALLIGACVLLMVVALLMYLTRRIDWYSPLEPA
jgi:inner membrane protein